MNETIILSQKAGFVFEDWVDRNNHFNVNIFYGNHLCAAIWGENETGAKAFFTNFARQWRNVAKEKEIQKLEDNWWEYINIIRKLEKNKQEIFDYFFYNFKE